MTKPKTLGELIAERQRAMMLTAVELAKELGVDPNTVARHKSGNRCPSPAHLRDYCRILKIKPADAVAADAETRKRKKK